MNEVFRPVEGYEGLYEVSNMGRVKSLGNDKTRKEKILKPTPGKGGYLKIFLYKEGKGKIFFVHRLVGQAFIPNPEGLPVINHKDENPSNNVVFLKDDGSVDECRSNLEWCTVKYNTNYGTGIERRVQTKISNGTYNPEMCGIIKNEGMKEYQRIYYQNNREKIQEYYQNNQEKIQEYHQEYYQNNRERLRERKREYYKNNRERLRERSLEYYKNNREKIRERRQEQYRRRKEKKSNL